MACELIVPPRMVKPSGAVREASSEPTLPPAPALLSTTTVVPSAGPSCWAIRRPS
ncbi:hypothetical protein D3C79_1074590 [compost metagenome]